ncbi:MAG TPA: lysylphosphatidylglycerol synthase domain-containing protein [Bacteroidia bacterium]|nr:lysylphosphatidylglycerol synthase domain-containing protein [Bacteroidia bacterium]
MNQNLISKFKFKPLNLLLVAMALAYLGYKFNDYHHQNYGKLFIEIFEKGNVIYFYTSITLISLNYGIEAKKWQILLRPLEKINWINALKSILAGITISIFTPNRTGEVIGKVVYLNLHEKLKAALLNFSGSMAQMICTSLLGLWGTIIYLNQYSFKSINLPAVHIIYIIAISCTILAFLIYFNQQKFFLWLGTKKWAKKIHINFTNQQQFNNHLQLQVLILSLLRYLVFSFQLVLLLKFCGINAPIFTLFLLSNIFFLVMWFLPSFALTELGVRGSVAVFLFQNVSDNISGALLAVVLLWIINVAFPALIGCFYVFNLTGKKTH